VNDTAAQSFARDQIFSSDRWPDETAWGECAIFGQRVPVRGSVLRYYLWLQIVAGWLLSAIFIAEVTGLVRSD
jgi:hypothetical protein